MRAFAIFNAELSSPPIHRTILHNAADGQSSDEAKAMPLLGWLRRGAAGFFHSKLM